MNAIPVEYHARPTRDRTSARGDYLVCVSPGVKRLHGLRTYAVVEHAPATLNGEKLVAVCRVHEDGSLHDDVVLMDQTVRHAIGIPYLGEGDADVRVTLAPLRLSVGQRIRDVASQWFGRRYAFVRAVKSDVSDLEKGICRLPCDAFSLLGCDPGDRILLQAPVQQSGYYELREVHVSAYEASPDWIKERKQQEEPSLKARYPAIDEILGVKPDVPHLYCDLEVRQPLSLGLLRPALARRDILNLFQKRFVDFGLIFFVSTLAIVQVLPVQNSWAVFAIVLVAAALLSSILVLLMLRSRVR